MARRLDASAPEFSAAFDRLVSAREQVSADAIEAARKIIADVRARGDTALIGLTQRFDGIALGPSELRVSEAEIDAAERDCTKEQLNAIDVAVRRIESFHRRQLPRNGCFVDEVGVELGWRWTALDSVGIYVPGGTASYPSSVLMNAVPARVAGVRRIAMATPTGKEGIGALVLAAAKRAGVSEIYRIGGAQAIAAFAFGTRSIAPVDKIVGPGNAYVAAAKREVFGFVGIDMIAGPTEVVIVADRTADPEWIAADLLSQAEHDRASQAILMTDASGLAGDVELAVDRSLERLPRRGIAQESWENHGAIIIVQNLADAPPLIDRIAPEHLQIVTADPQALSARVHHAGAIFLGAHTPEALGDYIAGPNHVLPTSRTARFSSGLSVLDFMKRTTILSCGREALQHLGPAALTLAEAEGLDAHARSIAVRLNTRHA